MNLPDYFKPSRERILAAVFGALIVVLSAISINIIIQRSFQSQEPPQEVSQTPVSEIAQTAESCQDIKDSNECNITPGCAWDRNVGCSTTCQAYTDPNTCTATPGCAWEPNWNPPYCFRPLSSDNTKTDKCNNDADCNPNETCISSPASGGNICLTKNAGANGAYCASPSGQPNHAACASSYCNPGTLTCATKPAGGGTGGPAPQAPAPPVQPLEAISYCIPETSGNLFVDVLWGKSEGATSYIVQIWDGTAWRTWSTVSGTVATLTGLAENNSTGWQVIAQNDVGSSFPARGPDFLTKTCPKSTSGTQPGTGGGTDTVTVQFTPEKPPEGTVGKDYMDAESLAVWTYSSKEGRFLNPNETTVTLASGVFPDGLVVQEDSVKEYIDGIPTKAGTFDFTLKSCSVISGACGSIASRIIIKLAETKGVYAVTGTVFIDTNKNKAIDPGESGYAGLSITIGGGGLSSPVTIKSDTSAFYYKELPTIRTYSLTVHVPSGYTLTTPEINPSTFQIGVSAPTADVDVGLFSATKSAPPPGGGGGGGGGTFPAPTGTSFFGGFCFPPLLNCPAGQACVNRKCVAPTVSPTVPGPTGAPTGPVMPTISPNDARLALELTILGVGPNTPLGQNPNPIRTSQSVELQIFNSQNQKVKDTQGTAIYDSQTFSFKGEVSLGTSLPDGTYLAKARFNNTLWKSLGVVDVKSAISSKAPSAKLVTGDLDQNNILDLSDYNMMLSCYGNSSCAQKEKADLNIDGVVDEKDLNILLTNFSKRQGD